MEEVETIASTIPDALSAAAQRQDAERLRSAVRALSAEQREAFILRHHHALSYEEVAGATAAPLGTVKWRIHET